MNNVAFSQPGFWAKQTQYLIDKLGIICTTLACLAKGRQILLISCWPGRVRIDETGDMQVASTEASPQAASQACSRLFEVDDALRQHMFPCLGLVDIMQLAGTCTAWRQLIIDTPMHQLPDEAQIAVLPSGLTSNLSLPSSSSSRHSFWRSCEARMASRLSSSVSA